MVFNKVGKIIYGCELSWDYIKGSKRGPEGQRSRGQKKSSSEEEPVFKRLSF
jgi:hypothetical protein